jgi:hypothetical protein
MENAPHEPYFPKPRLTRAADPYRSPVRAEEDRERPSERPLVVVWRPDPPWVEPGAPGKRQATADEIQALLLLHVNVCSGRGEVWRVGYLVLGAVWAVASVSREPLPISALVFLVPVTLLVVVVEVRALWLAVRAWSERRSHPRHLRKRPAPKPSRLR